MTESWWSCKCIYCETSAPWVHFRNCVIHFVNVILCQEWTFAQCFSSLLISQKVLNMCEVKTQEDEKWFNPRTESNGWCRVTIFSYLFLTFHLSKEEILFAVREKKTLRTVKQTCVSHWLEKCSYLFWNKIFLSINHLFNITGELLNTFQLLLSSLTYCYAKCNLTMSIYDHVIEHIYLCTVMTNTWTAFSSDDFVILPTCVGLTVAMLLLG